ncbi:MAG TPA: methylenetetrahydrofolate reductase [Sandaracinaceae bacterium LLY-WYZ-13_1]|nr:methylenetetrahydrofolate reductase [Sandaracinaceae bacterium LLY-WYZ-13_1]
MKVVDHLAALERPAVSFEIIPPLRGGSLASVLKLLEDLLVWRPPFVDITSHAAEAIYEETPRGIEKRIRRKRPGTLGLCAIVRHTYGVDAVPHVLCRGFDRQETEDMLIELRYLGIDNVLAVRGDGPAARPKREGGANVHASDLVQQIADMNRGRYLEELLDADPTDFCIGVGAYPEKHDEAPNLEADVRHLKEKVEAGADYAVTQMFFDNRRYFDFVEAARAAGIEIPIIPALKILTRARQLTTLPRTFHLDIPPELSEPVEAEPERALDHGVDWAVRQAEELYARGVPAVHFYVMQSAAPVSRVLERLGMPREERVSRPRRAT